MIKKSLLFLSFLWIIFLVFLVTQKEEEKGIVDSKQIESPAAATPKDSGTVEQVVMNEPPRPTVSESIPFTPLPSTPALPIKQKVDKEKKLTAKNEEKEPLVAKEVPISKPKDFGLVCTLIEPIPSRFRLVKWQGSRFAWLEDLEKFNTSSNSYPVHKFRVRVPYKEMLNPNTNESVFQPTTMGHKNTRIFIQSLHLEKKSLSYSGLSKPVGQVILKDFKIGGPSYQITAGEVTPMTHTYRIHFEQSLGPQKFFHDLTGKPTDHKFGLWGFEYQVIKLTPKEGKITVMRKDLKNLEFLEKELLAQNNHVE